MFKRFYNYFTVVIPIEYKGNASYPKKLKITDFLSNQTNLSAHDELAKASGLALKTKPIPKM